MIYTGADQAIDLIAARLRALSGEKLKVFAKRADRRFGFALDRVQVTDLHLRNALFDMMAADAELQRRKNVGAEP